jgi:hypothetical protein
MSTKDFVSGLEETVFNAPAGANAAKGELKPALNEVFI